MLRALVANNVPDLRAVINVGDDLVLHGLTICPDIDTVLYTLSGNNNEELGWGLRGETWRVMEELRTLGGEAWFQLGDRDLATHLYRSQRLREGANKTEVTRELAQHLKLTVPLLPVSDDDIATELLTADGWISFQDYFVRRRHDVAVSDVRYVGAATAQLSPLADQALTEADLVLIAPSNPILSIQPLLEVEGVNEALRRVPVAAVSPIIDGAAVKGPADRLLGELGHDVSVLGVARYYGSLVNHWIIDERDARYADELRASGHRVTVTDTMLGNRPTDDAIVRAILSTND